MFRQHSPVVRQWQRTWIGLDDLGPGLILEFGAGGGSSLRTLAEAVSPRPVFGFDWFNGLPEDWVTSQGLYHPRGCYRCDPPVDLPRNALLVRGLFEETLSPFLKLFFDPVAFVHVDCDLYRSASFVLMTLCDRLDGAIIAFDEFEGQPSCDEHEGRAWQEFIEDATYDFVRLGKQHPYAATFKLWKK